MSFKVDDKVLAGRFSKDQGVVLETSTYGEVFGDVVHKDRKADRVYKVRIACADGLFDHWYCDDNLQPRDR